ncbi:MAG: UDP-N-acetylglucosamine pyrophosphorylase [Syntrophales bacterium]|nr:UDP-N-acetylglucosamine pyrophosphorylase [Syntrophales bacterium]
MEMTLPPKVRQLMGKGVSIPNPWAVEIGEEVQDKRISGDGVVLYMGTKIYGEKTVISSGAKLGYESPVTVDDCQVGPQVELKGGFFASSVFMEKVSMGSGAQVRGGCILEEEVRGGHTVGLKQTILFPFVTLGSLINFCDCFMAGGASRKNHSEVGSSYIHFNYSPQQDKATPSLIGDVPRGVMLNQPPIFLGGQGGLVGPVRIGYGTVIAAGTVCRKDCPEGGKLLMKGGNLPREKILQPGFYRDIRGRVYNNICYLANILALRQWYIHVRQPFFQLEELGKELHAGAIDKLDFAISERLKQFQILSGKMEKSMELGRNLLKGKRSEMLLSQQGELLRNWPEIEGCFTRGHEEAVDLKNRDAFLEIIHRQIEEEGRNYIKVIQGLEGRASTIGTTWLQNIVDKITDMALKHQSSAISHMTYDL